MKKAWMLILPLMLATTGCTYRAVAKTETFEQDAVVLKRIGYDRIPLDYYINAATVGDWDKVFIGAKSPDGNWEVVAFQRFSDNSIKRLVCYRVEFGSLRSYELRTLDEQGYYGAVINGTLLPK